MDPTAMHSGGIGCLAKSKPLLRFTTVLAKCRKVAPCSIKVGRRPVVKAKPAVAWLLSLGKSLFATSAYTLPQYPAHWALPSQTSDGMATGDTTRHGDCLRLCTYNARTVSTDTDLAGPLEAAERVKFHVIALEKTKC
ncbi:hypothetical protein RB195_007241 [Necator americanus]|uniref:Uncharacterized protein n=1 Tax=Necator americanus TaxID=51031 RepID=A0ABR1BZL0_NECAM